MCRLQNPAVQDEQILCRITKSATWWINLTPARCRWRSTSLKEAPIILLSWERNVLQADKNMFQVIRNWGGSEARGAFRVSAEGQKRKCWHPVPSPWSRGQKVNVGKKTGSTDRVQSPQRRESEPCQRSCREAKRSSSRLAAFCERKGGRINLGMTASEKQKRK